MSHHTFVTTGGSWTVPTSLLRGAVQVDARGGAGENGGSVLGYGGKGGRVQGTIPIAPGGVLKVTTYSGGAGGSYGHSPQYGLGGKGGNAAAVLTSTTSVLVVAGGGGGGGGGAPKPWPGGNGGNGGQVGTGGTTSPSITKTFAPTSSGKGGAGATTTAAGAGGAAGTSGSHNGTAGAGGSGHTGGAGGTIGTPTIISAGAGGGGGGGYFGGGGGGSGSESAVGGGGGGGSSYAAASVTGTAFTTGFGTTINALVIFSYTTADADLTPTLIAPSNGAYADMTKSGTIRFKRNPGTQSGTLNGWVVWRRKGATAAQYWDAATSAWSASAVVNAVFYLTSLGTYEYSYTFPTGKWTDGVTWQWSVQTQNRITNVNYTSPFAPVFVVHSVSAPTITTVLPTTPAAPYKRYVSDQLITTATFLEWVATTTKAAGTAHGNAAVHTLQYYPLSLGRGSPSGGYASFPAPSPTWLAKSTYPVRGRRFKRGTWSISAKLKMTPGATPATAQVQAWLYRGTTSGHTLKPLLSDGTTGQIPCAVSRVGTVLTVSGTRTLDAVTLASNEVLFLYLVFYGSFPTSVALTVEVGGSALAITSPGIETTVSVAQTTKPTITWDASVTSGHLLSKYRMLIYTQAQATSPDFVVAGTTPVFDTGTVTSTRTFATVSTALQNNTQYAAFVKVTETGTVTSSWTRGTFMVQIPPNGVAPSLALTAETDANGHPINKLVLSSTQSPHVGYATIERIETVSYDDYLPSFGPTGWWKLADSNGSGSLIDSSGHAHGGVVLSGIVLGEPGPFPGDTADTSALCRVNHGASDISTSAKTTGFTQFTVVGWIKATQLPGYSQHETLISASTTGFALGLGTPATTTTATKPAFKVSNRTTTVTARSSSALPTGEWVMLAGTWDNSALRLYQNGVLVAGPVSLSGGSLPTGSLNLCSSSGTTTAPSFYAAQIAIFPKALTAADIANLYSLGVANTGTSSVWTPIRDATQTPVSTNTLTVYDRTAPLGVAVRYRAVTWSTVTTILVPSPYSGVVTDVLPNDNWWIMDPTTPSSAVALQRAQARMAIVSGGGTASIQFTQNENQGQFSCFGRPNYVAVHGTLMNEEFKLTLTFTTLTLYNRFMTLRSRQRTLLLKSDMGKTYFITLGPSRPAVLLRATDRITSPIYQFVVHCYPATPV